GAQTVVVPYVTIDNAGVASVTPGSVTAGFTVAVSVSGNVFNDPDALNVNNSSGDANLVPAGMTVILVDNTTGLVTANTSVGTDGVFDFGNVSPGDYTVVLSTTAGTIGSTPPATDLPAGWLNTGEFTGTPDSGNDGSVNGSSEVFTVTATDVTNVNFGIQQPPTANVVVLDEMVNPGGTIAIDITSEFGGSDPTKNGLVTALEIIGFPTNATSISIDGVLYTDLTSIETAYPNGIPTDASGVPTVPILVDPIDGDQTVVVPYFTIDNAGVASVAPGSVTLPLNSGLPVTLIDFNAEYRESKVAIDWKVAAEKDFGYYEVQRASDAKSFIGIATIEGSNRTNYSYEDVSPLVGTSYYRLKMVDLDGSYAYSHIRSVARTGVSVMLYPNPVVHTLKVQDDAWSTVNSITIYNISGISVMTRTGKQLSNELDIRSLQDGAYTLKLGRTNGTTSFYKFLIIK
ncbi:putative secreted protein (Por secretion system target), partial [Dyadobacter jejuensis]